MKIISSPGMHFHHTLENIPTSAASSKPIGRQGEACLSLLLFILLLILSPAVSYGQMLFPDSKADVPSQDHIIPMIGVPDSELEAKLSSVLSHIEAFKNIRVKVHDGVALMTGGVLRAEARKKAEELVSRFEGVVYVVNQVEVESEVEGRVNPAITKVREYFNQFLQQLPVITVAIMVVVAFWLLSLLIIHWDAPYKRMRINPLMQGLIRQTLRTVILVMGILLALDILDVTALVGAIIGAAGLIGLAIGFGFRDIVENYLAGIFLSLRSPFTVNDLVRIENHEGRVVRLTSREMVLMTLDGNHVRIPNALVFKSVIHNYTRNPLRRFDFLVGVGVNEDLLTVQKVGCDTLRAMRGVMSDPGPFMRVVELGDFNVMVRFFGWVDQRTADFLKVNSEAIRLVKAALDKAGVEMPEPIRTIRVRQIEPPETIQSVQRMSLPQEFVEEEVKKADVSVDTQLDEQIEEDLAASSEKNLLTREV